MRSSTRGTITSYPFSMTELLKSVARHTFNCSQCDWSFVYCEVTSEKSAQLWDDVRFQGPFVGSAQLWESYPFVGLTLFVSVTDSLSFINLFSRELSIFKNNSILSAIARYRHFRDLLSLHPTTLNILNYMYLRCIKLLCTNIVWNIHNTLSGSIAYIAR